MILIRPHEFQAQYITSIMSYEIQPIHIPVTSSQYCIPYKQDYRSEIITRITRTRTYNIQRLGILCVRSIFIVPCRYINKQGFFFLQNSIYENSLLTCDNKIQRNHCGIASVEEYNKFH